ncbi:MAG TPA: Uma2 family endonuclease [Tepidisphaeraceae bacterium]|nr:Uma2 family endonuclease [Tepidisphaeraceae bacterium]
MSQIANRVTPSITPKGKIPPLQNGDHLTRDEFERRFDATPGLKHAELINGIVYLMAPISYGGHSAPHAELITILSTYRAATSGVASGGNSSVRIDGANMPEPDAFLMILAPHGGQAKIDADDYVSGVPELVVEISATSASFDLHEKMDLYRRAGVREYLVWQTLDNEINLFSLKQGKFRPLAPAADGTLRSKVFPGLWLDVAALLKGDLATALKTLQAGIAAPEHQLFTTALQKPRAAKKKL